MKIFKKKIIRFIIMKNFQMNKNQSKIKNK